ncbi:hypothetical protein AB0K15_36850 [Amycolatopsis sp. NPDC049253]|uniref:hypothetical protein n=1 Tax=Amycolatopsis sp. NPDC049253 TaxID=3155274 RepID=UPI003413B37E
MHSGLSTRIASPAAADAPGGDGARIGLTRVPLRGRTCVPVLSASIVGYLALSPLAHRIGHRKLVIAATALFGVFTVRCAVAGNDTLIAPRPATGAGLGAAIGREFGHATVSELA